MSTLTPNYGLHLPENTDSMDDFFTNYESDMTTIDDHLGSGGGGGNVYGAFIDTNRVLATYNSSGGSAIPSYTALEDCFVAFYVFGKNSQTCHIYVDSVEILTIYFQGDGVQSPTLYLKKGQTLSFSSFDYWSFHYEIYGLTQGTNGIFTPIIYSDTERVVGVWRDNKPLYQKCINYGNLPNNGERYVAHGIANVDKIFIVGGFVTTGTAFYNLEHATDSNYDWTSRVDGTNATIETHTDCTNLTAIIVVQYTKTTDVAGSGNWNTDGVPTVHYDGTEKIIGTWFGETLYEKTIHIVEQSEQTNKNYTSEIASLNASHIKLKNAEVKLGSNGGNAWYTAPFWYDGSYNMCVAVSPNDMNIFSRGWKYTEAYVTLQYTKSS